METIETYKKVLAMWRPFNNQVKVRINDKMVSTKSFAYCLEQVKREKENKLAQDRLKHRWQELAEVGIPEFQAPSPSYFQKVVTKVKTAYNETRRRIEYGDPNRLHPVWGRPLKSWEYLWLGIKNLSFERQQQLIPCHIREFGSIHVTEENASRFADVNPSSDMGKNGWFSYGTIDTDDREPNVESALKQMSTFDDGKGLKPNTDIKALRFR